MRKDLVSVRPDTGCLPFLEFRDPPWFRKDIPSLESEKDVIWMQLI
jgi:hypothetical protein